MHLPGALMINVLLSVIDLPWVPSSGALCRMASRNDHVEDDANTLPEDRRRTVGCTAIECTVSDCGPQRLVAIQASAALGETLGVGGGQQIAAIPPVGLCRDQRGGYHRHTECRGLMHLVGNPGGEAGRRHHASSLFENRAKIFDRSEQIQRVMIESA